MDRGAPPSALLALLGRERRRALRGMDGSQLVLLRLQPGRAAETAASVLTDLAEECDSVLAPAPDMVILHLPGAGPAMARACLKRVLARPETDGAVALLASLPAAAWERAEPAAIAEEIRRRLDDCLPGERVRRIVLMDRRGADTARVTADERSFLLSPLRP